MDLAHLTTPDFRRAVGWPTNGDGNVLFSVSSCVPPWKPLRYCAVKTPTGSRSPN